MRILEVSAKGLKSGDFVHKLGAVTVVAGPNWSGKTAVLEAIRLGLIGYLPELGKTNSSTFQLCRGTTLSLRLDLEERQIMRTWTMERGTVKVAAAGDIIEVPPVLLDSNEYFGLGAKDQVRYVFGLASGEFGAKLPQQIIAAIKNIKLNGHSEHHEEGVNKLIGRVEALDDDRRRLAQPVHEWLADLIAGVTVDNRTAKQNVERMAKTVQGLVQIQQSEDPAFQRDNTREMTKLRADLATVNNQIGEARAGQRQLEREIAERDALVKELEKVATVDTEAMEARLRTLTKQTTGYQSHTREAQEKLFAMERESNKARADRDAAKREMEKLNAQFKTDIAHKACPFCGSRKAGWTKEITARFELAGGKLLDAISAADMAISRLAVELQIATETVTVAQAADWEHAERVKEAQQLTAKLQQASAVWVARGRQKDRLAQLREKDIEDELAREQAEIMSLADKASGLALDIGRLETAQRAFVEGQQDAKRNAQTLLEHQRVKAEQQVLGEALKLLESIQVEAVKQAFGTILERANAFTRGILKSPVEYRDGELGRFEGPTWVTHRTFSGAEKVLTYAGIACALAHHSPIKIVLIDELNGRVDSGNIPKVLARFVELAQSGAIDQVVCCATSDAWCRMPGVNIIPL